MATKNSVVKPVNINRIEFEYAPITIEGITPLIVHAWSEKARTIMREKQMGASKKTKHDIRVPVNDFISSMYWLSDMPELGADDDEAMTNFLAAIESGAHFGFPVIGIKSSIVKGSSRGGLDVKMTELRGTFLLEGTGEYGNSEFAEIVSDAPKMREDMVMVGGSTKSADLRYRGEFDNWHCDLLMRYNKNGKYSLEQILNCIDYGGFVSGIGEWRPEKNGSGQFGMYQLKC